MTAKQRAKHATEHAIRILTPEPTIDLKDFVEPKTSPRLSWLNARTHSGFSNRKCRSGRRPEQSEGVMENARRILEKAIQGETNATGPNLSNHQIQVPIVAAGTPQA